MAVARDVRICVSKLASTSVTGSATVARGTYWTTGTDQARLSGASSIVEKAVIDVIPRPDVLGSPGDLLRTLSSRLSHCALPQIHLYEVAYPLPPAHLRTAVFGRFSQPPPPCQSHGICEFRRCPTRSIRHHKSRPDESGAASRRQSCCHIRDISFPLSHAPALILIPRHYLYLQLQLFRISFVFHTLPGPTKWPSLPAAPSSLRGPAPHARVN